MPCESEGNENVQNGSGCQPEAEGFMARLKEFWNGGETA